MKRFLYILASCISLTLMTSTAVFAEEVIISSPHEDMQEMKKQLPEHQITFSNSDRIVVDLSKDEQHAFKQTFPESVIEKDVSITTFQQLSPKPTWNLALLKYPFNATSIYTGKKIKIAVIDTGVNLEASLRTSVKQHVSFAPDDPKTTINESDAMDRGHNGLGHGTLVTSIIAAQPNSLNGFSQGIAPDASIYALKYTDGTKKGTSSAIIRAIEWSIAHNMDIINLSSGLQVDLQAMHQVVKKANAAGILVVASTGNDGYYENIRYPARYKEAVSVGSINRYADISSFSNHRGRVDFLAPGEDVPAINRSGTVSYVTGTSFAAPHITGLFALLKERYPYSSNEQLIQKLKQMKTNQFFPVLTITPMKTLENKPSISTEKVTDHTATFLINNRNLEEVVILQNERIIKRVQSKRVTLQQLSANKKQSFTFRFVNQSGDFSDATSATIQTKKDKTKPSSPKELKAFLLPTGQVKLTWKQSSSTDFSKNILSVNGKQIKQTRASQIVLPKIPKKKVQRYTLKAVDQSGNQSKAIYVRVIRYR